MPIELDLESVEGIAIGIADGPMTLDEIKRSAAEMWQRLDAPQMRILWDLREARFDLSSDEVRVLAEFVKGAAPSTELRTAFLVGTDFEFGLVRMFQVYREKEGADTAVFRDRSQALDWLAGKGGER